MTVTSLTISQLFLGFLCVQSRPEGGLMLLTMTIFCTLAGIILLHWTGGRILRRTISMFSLYPTLLRIQGVATCCCYCGPAPVDPATILSGVMTKLLILWHLQDESASTKCSDKIAIKRMLRVSLSRINRLVHRLSAGRVHRMMTSVASTCKVISGNWK